MAYIFTDLPADSSDLDTFDGYHIARTATIARGGPCKQEDPSAGPEELILTYPSATRAYPRYLERTVRRSVNAMTRVMPGRRIGPYKFMTNGQMASMAVVPTLYFLMVWVLGQF